MDDESKFKMAYTKAVRTGILNLQQQTISNLPDGVFKLHEFVPDDDGWWELLVPHTLLLTHNEISNLMPPHHYNWNDAWKELKILNISYNEITEIPMEILKLEFLRKIIFHHNKIKNIRFINTSSHNLQHIELQNNNLESLGENIGELINLRYLNISHNKLLSLPQSLSKCIKLEVFEATNNNINGDLHNIDFSKCVNLKQFDISFNKITSIPSSLFYLPSLYRLSATQNRINKIYVSLNDENEEKEKEKQKDSYLIDLYLGNNNLSQFPFDKIKLHSLKLLDLKGNKFAEIDKNISECCVNLERFDISGNNLQDIPAQISMIENIKCLIVTGNPLRRINKSVINDSYLLINYLRKRLISTDNDKELENISNTMNKLNINGNELKLNKQNLTSLPSNISKMINLCHLELDDNKLSDISDLKYCKKLEYLSLIKNNIENIHCLFDLNKLKVIDLRINKLKKLNYEKEIGSNLSIWPKLHSLRMGHNQIKEISEFLKYISSSNMTVLDVSNNNITIFPQSILNWKLLQVLDLSNNDLSNIPFELGLMPKLNALLLSGNRLRRMTSIINTGNTQKILQWLTNRI